MYLDKVKDIKKIRLGKNQLLIELVSKKSTIILASTDGEPKSTVIREQIALANVEEGSDIEVGDIILEARYNGNSALHKIILPNGDVKEYMIANLHDIRMWTKPENFNLN
jgi:hypothetical protein